jgi:hypothetical protein
LTDYKSQDIDDEISAAAKISTSQLSNADTPARLERAQVYKVLLDMLIESFDGKKRVIERYKQDAESQLVSQIRGALQQRADDWCAQFTLAKLEAINALRLDFDRGKRIEPQNLVAQYANQPTFNPFDYREILGDVSALYDFSCLDTMVGTEEA